MRARITIYGAGGGGGAGSSTYTAQAGGAKNGTGGGAGAMFTFVNYDVSATLWDNSAGLLALAGGGAGGRPDQITTAQSPYGGEGGAAGGGPPLPAAWAAGGTNAGSGGTNTTSPAGYMPSFYDAIWNPTSNPSYPYARGVGGGGGGRGGYLWDTNGTGGDKGYDTLSVGGALTMYNGWGGDDCGFHVREWRRRRQLHRVRECVRADAGRVGRRVQHRLVSGASATDERVGLFRRRRGFWQPDDHRHLVLSRVARRRWKIWRGRGRGRCVVQLRRRWRRHSGVGETRR